MQRVAVIGLGDMGSGLAKNLLAAGIAVNGFDLSEARMNAFVEMGGTACTSAEQAGEGAECAFIMVMNGEQVHAVVFGEEGNGGLKSTMAQGGRDPSDRNHHTASGKAIGRRSAGIGPAPD